MLNGERTDISPLNEPNQIESTLQHWSSINQNTRLKEELLAMLRIGHTTLTHSLTRERVAPPLCHRCHSPQPIRHFVLTCLLVMSRANCRLITPPPPIPFHSILLLSLVNLILISSLPSSNYTAPSTSTAPIYISSISIYTHIYSASLDNFI